MGTIPKYDSSSIKSLTDLEDFRLNSSQYVGSGGIDTDVQLFLEICLNATDEAIDRNKIYHIKVIFFTNGKKYQVAIQDHGRGIPIESLEAVYTKSHTSGKYDASAYYGLSSGCWGVGSKLTTALSNHFISISKRPDGFGGVKFAKGVTQDYKKRKNPLDKNDLTNGTTVIYEPDPTIVKETELYMTDPRGLMETLKKLEFMSVFRPNIKFTVYQVNELLSEDWFNMTFVDQWKFINNFVGPVIYQSPDNVSIFEYARKECGVTDHTVWQYRLHKDINITDDNDLIGYDIELGLTAHPERESGLLGIMNGNIISVPTSSHIQVMQNVIKSKLVRYLDEDNTDLRSYFEQQYNIPFHGYVNAHYKNAKFIGQVKSSFVSLDFSRIYSASLEHELEKIDDDVFERLFDLIQEDLAKKFSQSMSRVLNTGKSLKNVGFELSRFKSYYACETRDKSVATLNIVEGLSSGNWVVQLRDSSYQAVYELRGKCINTFVSTPDSWRKDDVFCDLVRLIGVHPRDTNLDNMNFKEIVIMADADPDGLSIIDLLIGMFYKINPLILDQGRVKIAMPPLYVVSAGNKTKYLRDQKALDDFKVILYQEKLRLSASTNAQPPIEITGSAYRDVVYLIKHICSLIEDTSRKLAIDPFIVEQMCHCTDFIQYTASGALRVDIDSIKQRLGLSDCIFTKSNNVLTLIHGSMEVSIPVDRLINEIEYHLLPVLERYNWRNFDLYVTTRDTDCYKQKAMMFWQIKQIFDKLDNAFSVRRLKGLGECTADELKHTCLDPNTRTVMTIYGIGDAKILHDMLGEDTAERKKLVLSDMGSEWVRGDL